MLSRSARVLTARTPTLFRATLPEGFSFVEKLADKDIATPFEVNPKVSVTFTRQDDLIMKQQLVDNVRLATSSGDIGVRSGHEYKIAKLVPGLITIEKDANHVEKYFTSGGFAHINNDGSVDINTVEAIPLSEFEPAYVDRELIKYKEDLKGAKGDKEKAIAEIYVSVYEALQTALKSA